MRVLYIEHYAGAPEYGMEYRPYYLAREWVKQGNEVTIVAASFSHLRGKQPRQTAHAYLEEIDGINYLWLPTPPYKGNGFGRIRNILAFILNVRQIPSLLPGVRFDAVIASSTYPFDNGIAHRLAKKWNAVHVYEVHDLWPLSPIELGGYSPYHPIIIATQISEDRAYRNADLVVSLLPKAEEYMRTRGLTLGKFHYIPNGIDTTEWNGIIAGLPDEVSSILDPWSEGRFLVCYAGAHGIANALDSLIDAARECPEAGFVLVGTGPERGRLMAKAEDLKNVLFLNAIPKWAIPALLERMDVLYIGLQHQSLFRFGISPNKLMDYMIAGKPVICAIEAGNDIIKDAHCGISVAAENAVEILHAIRELMSLEGSERLKLGMNGRSYVLKYHDYRVLSASFMNAMQDTVKYKHYE